MRAAVLFVATGGFVGYIPVASGTFGSLVAIPLFLAFVPLQASSALLSIALYGLLVAGACWAAGRADELLGDHDSHKIVIDEIVGYLAATLFLEPTWTAVWVAFLIFRVFDIVKPFPAGYFDEQVSGGTGVVLDDVVSGIYANLATRLVLWVI